MTLVTGSEPIATTIEAHDRRAMSSADHVSFVHKDGQSYIQATREGRNTSDGFDQSHTVFCLSVIQDYRRDRPVDRKYSCYHAFMHAKFDHGEWRSILANITNGARLTLGWVVGNDNENNREIGWRRDELRIQIETGEGSKRKIKVFLVAVEVGPVNTASMVRDVW